MLSLNNKKFFFLFKLKFNFLNYNYLCFIKYYNYNLKNLCIRYGLELLKIQSKNCKKIFIKNKGFFMNLNQSLIYFNDFKKFSDLSENLNINNIFLFSWNGFFLNNKYLKKIHNYYLFYNNNFKLFIYIIFTNINRFKLVIFSLIFKFINILYLMYQNKKK